MVEYELLNGAVGLCDYVGGCEMLAMYLLFKVHKIRTVFLVRDC